MTLPPGAFYSDKHSVFRVAKSDAKTGHQTTQFGRALPELNIEILCANSSQAKGQVERKNRTLQDRLVKEMRLDAVTDMDAGNDWLPDTSCATTNSLPEPLPALTTSTAP